MTRLGSRLRALRLKRGVSQNELRRRSGLETSYLSKVENGVHVPGLRNLERIARALGVSLAQALGPRPALRRRPARSPKGPGSDARAR